MGPKHPFVNVREYISPTLRALQVDQSWDIISPFELG